MKTKWTKKAPKQTGWYWVKYIGKNGIVICPAKLIELSKWGDPYEWSLHTAKNDFIYCGDQKDLKFGNEIQKPA